MRILGISIFLLASWGIGGPILGLPAIALVFWLWKRSKAKSLQKSAADATEAEVHSGDSSSDSWPSELIEACSVINNHGYYVGNLIPDRKRVSATKNYPLPRDPEILALIDGTVFGTAERGLAVGRYGIAWKDLFDKNPIQITWDVMAEKEVTLSDTKVNFGALGYQGSGSGVPTEKIEALFRSLHDYSLTFSSNNEIISGRKRIQDLVKKRSTKSFDPSNVEKPVVPINTSDFEDLLGLPGIGAAEAQMIIKRRREQAFTSNVELTDYLDLKPHIATKLDGLTVFEPTSSGSQASIAEFAPVANNVPKPNPLGGRTID